MSADETKQDDQATPDVEPTAGVEIDTAVETDKGSTAADTSQAGDTSSKTPPRRLGAIPVIPLALVLGLLASGGLAAWVYFSQYRPDRRTDNAVETTAVNAARNGTVALLSYKPDTLSQDLEAAKSHLSGDFRNYYDEFTKQVISPAAQSKGVRTMAQVVGAAATELHANSAVVLVFVNQVTASNERPDPSMASSSVLVSLANEHGNWLITKFDPL